MADDPMIELRSVSKTYFGKHGGTPALDDVSLTVARNEFVSVIGPSGCGKTTLLKVVAGLLEADEGTVVIAGRPVCGPASDRIGMVFQNFALLPWATVRANIMFALGPRNMSKKEATERTEDALMRVGLTEFRDRHPHQLSGGMQQRVGLARALAVDPDVLLMDEPFGAVDAQTRRVLQEDLLTLWQEQNKTVLFITHAMDEAVYLSDRVIVMKPRPARIADELVIDIERPRVSNAAERDSRYGEYENTIWSSLASSARDSQLDGMR